MRGYALSQCSALALAFATGGEDQTAIRFVLRPPDPSPANSRIMQTQCRGQIEDHECLNDGCDRRARWIVTFETHSRPNPSGSFMEHHDFKVGALMDSVWRDRCSDKRSCRASSSYYPQPFC